MRLAPTSEYFEWDDEEESYYDDDVTNVDDNDFSYEVMCIYLIRISPLEFKIFDGIMVIGGKALEVDAYEYLRRDKKLSKEIQEFLSYWEFCK